MFKISSRSLLGQGTLRTLAVQHPSMGSEAAHRKQPSTTAG